MKTIEAFLSLAIVGLCCTVGCTSPGEQATVSWTAAELGLTTIEDQTTAAVAELKADRDLAGILVLRLEGRSYRWAMVRLFRDSSSTTTVVIPAALRPQELDSNGPVCIAVDLLDAEETRRLLTSATRLVEEAQGKAKTPPHGRDHCWHWTVVVAMRGKTAVVRTGHCDPIPEVAEGLRELFP